MLNKLKRWRTKADYWEQSQATEMLHNAWSYLYRDFSRRASTNERGRLLPEQQEALDMLHKLARESLDRQCDLT